MAGPTEEAGKALGAVADALRTSPMLLALVLLQAVTLGLICWSSIERQQAISEQFTNVYLLLDHCMAKGDAK